MSRQDCMQYHYLYSRLVTRLTCIALQDPPRAVSTRRTFNSAAIPRSEVLPDALMLAMSGRTFSAKIFGPVAKFFQAWFADELRSAEPASAQWRENANHWRAITRRGCGCSGNTRQRRQSKQKSELLLTPSLKRVFLRSFSNLHQNPAFRALKVIADVISVLSSGATPSSPSVPRSYWPESKLLPNGVRMLVWIGISALGYLYDLAELFGSKRG